MPIDAEKEITRLWRALHGAQDEIGKTYYRWRQVALEFAGPGAKPLDVGLRAAEIFGKEIGKSLLPRQNWLKGEEAFLMNLVPGGHLGCGGRARGGRERGCAR